MEQTRISSNSGVSEIEVFLDRVLDTMSLMSDQQNVLSSKVAFLESENATLKTLVMGGQNSLPPVD